jgi:integrase
MVALTKKAIDRFKYDGRSMDFRPDGEGGVPNFGVRVYKGGTKSFVLGYRLPGSRKQRWLTIGKYGVFTVQQARERARAFLVDLARGVDPKASTKAEGVTLGGFAPIYMDDMRTRGMKTAGEMERRIQKHLVPQLGKKDLVDITRAEVTKLHGAIGKTAKIEANRCIQLLKAMLNRAEMMGHLPAGSVNPCKGIDLYKETSRTRYLDTRELMALRGALQDEPAWVHGLIRFYLVSGLRKMELLSLPWNAVKINHPEGDHIDISMTKNGRSLRLALTPEMASIIQSIPSRMNSPWVFPSPVRPAHHLSDFKKVWQRVRSKAGLEDVNVHDLRRTCGSIMAQNGVPIESISMVLNHSDSEITRVYARMHKDNQRDALAVSSKVLDEVFGELVPQRAEVSD